MFLERLISLLNESGLTKKQFLSDVGLGKNSFAYWEKTGNVPNQATVSSIASYFGVSVGYLLGEEDKKEKPTDTDGLSENMKQLIAFARSVPDDKVELVLKVIKSIAEDA